MSRRLPDALLRARALVQPALAAAVERLSPGNRRVVAYHLGWVDADGQPARGQAGKALRPALALLSAEAAGAPAAVGVPGAVAVELVHNFSLLHDDVMDGDVTRRHRPTAWTLFGVGAAVLAGDALLVLAHELLLEQPTPERVRAAASLARATGEVMAGQDEDVAFERRATVTVAETLAMSGRKTGALVACAASVGAVLAGAPAPVCEALHEFGYRLGLAFQAVDDVLGTWGSPEVTGKQASSDLRQRKKTLPVAAALEAGGPAAGRLGALLGNGHTLGDDELALAAALVEQAGGRRRAVAEADRQLGLALAELEHAPIDPTARAELVQVARFVATREL